MAPGLVLADVETVERWPDRRIVWQVARFPRVPHGPGCTPSERARAHPRRWSAKKRKATGPVGVTRSIPRSDRCLQLCAT